MTGDALKAVLQRHRSLAEAVAWGLAQSPPRVVAEVVTQDEYTHDVILPVGDQRFAVYDTT